MNIDEVKNQIKYLKEDKFSNEFYVALILYDIKGLSPEDIDDDMVKRAYEIIDDYDSIYNDDMRDRVLYDFDLEEEQEEEAELEYE